MMTKSSKNNKRKRMKKQNLKFDTLLQILNDVKINTKKSNKYRKKQIQMNKNQNKKNLFI